jgi:hypothetical protein
MGLTGTDNFSGLKICCFYCSKKITTCPLEKFTEIKKWDE